MKYIHHDDLFNGSYFARVLADDAYPRERKVEDAARRLKQLLDIWIGIRGRFVEDLPESKALPTPFVGLPPTMKPRKTPAEAEVEGGWIKQVMEDVLGYACKAQKSMVLDALKEKEKATHKDKRPDWVVFRDEEWLTGAVKAAEALKTAVPATVFCRDADFILDAKQFSKGVGADEEGKTGEPAKGKKHRDTSAAQDIDQVERYLRGSGKTWGILTNGRSWRLMRAGEKQAHLRFDLVLFLEDLRGGGRTEPADFTEEDLKTFALFFYLFGPPAVGGGYLDLLRREGEANTRRVSDILRQNAHEAVRLVAEGFWRHPDNGYEARIGQARLDHLRELALTFLYRLLFILKAEAQGLLPMQDANGGPTKYAKHASTRAIFDRLITESETELKGIDNGYRQLRELFSMVDQGNRNYDVPAYNGGLFDADIHKELETLRLNDDVVFDILKRLIYLDESEPVPYADLDVRDFGDIYEGLLEQRLTRERIGDGWCLILRNKKGERKASGSYFTPDSLVEHLVREAVTPLLDACQGDPEKILALRVLDPAMGSGHFLVKVVDIMAWHLTLNCAPIDEGVPDDNGPDEYAYWKRLVVENCVFGVDVNPMAVELAKVALWLHTAGKGKPLSFLNHHLKFGNSLVGADLRDVANPGLASKAVRSGAIWSPRPPAREETTPAPAKKKKKKTRQMELPFDIDTHLFSGILESVGKILQRRSDKPEDVKSKRRDYEAGVAGKLALHRILCDLWCAQWFMADPDETGIAMYEAPNGLYARVKKACGLMDEKSKSEAMAALTAEPFIQKIDKARNEGYGPRPMRFFHWQLEFPEAAFTPDGRLRETFGFDAVVGNPPWDKIKPAKRDFYGPFSDEVANRQGTSLNALIADLENEMPELADGWSRYEKTTLDFAAFLSRSELYRHQVTEVDGKRTGGDPDLFRYFTERAAQCVRPGGRVGFLVPCTLWQGQGCTALRKLLFEKCRLHSLYTFENYRKWAFYIHSSFKFTAFVFSNESPGKEHSFPAAFMLRDTQVLEGRMRERVVNLSAEYVKAVSPSSLALIDTKSDGEAAFIGKIHKNLPALGSEESGWRATYRTDLHMTADSWCFKTREWMNARGFTRVSPVKKGDEWVQETVGPPTAKLPSHLPAGGEYWMSADEDFYRNRGYIERSVAMNGEKKTFFIHPDDAALENKKSFNVQKDFRRIFPSERYTALYEGRMVHLFDHAQKRYLHGEGRKAIWEDIPIGEKTLRSRVFVSKMEAGKEFETRVGFCDITGATNERTILSCLVSSENVAGNKVPTLSTNSTEKTSILQTLVSSFCADFLIRLRISTTLNWIYFSNLAVPKYDAIPPETRTDICRHAAKLNCTTPELADVWNAVFPDDPWTYDSAERDLWKRAELRAELDAIVADLYGLAVPEYARVLTGFPLLDRDQPPLPGDFFLTEGDEKTKGKKGETWIDTDWGVFELKPRSFITRDFALKTYMERKNHPMPQDLAAWYRDKVGLDPEDPLSRFRIGDTKDLLDRIEIAKSNGAVPYIPTGSSDGAEDSSEPE